MNDSLSPSLLPTPALCWCVCGKEVSRARLCFFRASRVCVFLRVRLFSSRPGVLVFLEGTPVLLMSACVCLSVSVSISVPLCRLPQTQQPVSVTPDGHDAPGPGGREEEMSEVCWSHWPFLFLSLLLCAPHCCVWPHLPRGADEGICPEGQMKASAPRGR